MCVYIYRHCMRIQLQISGLVISHKPQGLLEKVLIQYVYTQEFRNNFAKDAGVFILF